MVASDQNKVFDTGDPGPVPEGPQVVSDPALLRMQDLLIKKKEGDIFKKKKKKKKQKEKPELLPQQANHTASQSVSVSKPSILFQALTNNEEARPPRKNLGNSTPSPSTSSVKLYPDSATQNQDQPRPPKRLFKARLSFDEEANLLKEVGNASTKQCLICKPPMIFTKKFLLIKHLKSEHGLKVKTCPNCHLIFRLKQFKLHKCNKIVDDLYAFDEPDDLPMPLLLPRRKSLDDSSRPSSASEEPKASTSDFMAKRHKSVDFSVQLKEVSVPLEPLALEPISPSKRVRRAPSRLIEEDELQSSPTKTPEKVNGKTNGNHNGIEDQIIEATDDEVSKLSEVDSAYNTDSQVSNLTLTTKEVKKLDDVSTSDSATESISSVKTNKIQRRKGSLRKASESTSESTQLNGNYWNTDSTRKSRKPKPEVEKSDDLEQEEEHLEPEEEVKKETVQTPVKEVVRKHDRYYTPEHRKLLMDTYERTNKYPTKQDMSELAKIIGVLPIKILWWYTHRRRQDRRKGEISESTSPSKAPKTPTKVLKSPSKPINDKTPLKIPLKRKPDVKAVGDVNTKSCLVCDAKGFKKRLHLVNHLRQEHDLRTQFCKPCNFIFKFGAAEFGKRTCCVDDAQDKSASVDEDLDTSAEIEDDEEVPEKVTPVKVLRKREKAVFYSRRYKNLLAEFSPKKVQNGNDDLEGMLHKTSFLRNGKLDLNYITPNQLKAVEEFMFGDPTIEKVFIFNFFEKIRILSVCYFLFSSNCAVLTIFCCDLWSFDDFFLVISPFFCRGPHLYPFAWNVSVQRS